ncbi:MAG: ABC transporter permease [Oscillospiraceae bacterium]|nr:ABC transporter permease [Oscillospiraceae bacterium]
MSAVILNAVSLGLLWAVMTAGVFISYRVLGMADLSAEGTITLGASVAARLMTLESGAVNPYLATLLAMLAGMLAGAVTGLLHTKLKIPALLAGILVMTALYSVNIRIMGKATISLLRMDTIFSLAAEATGLEQRLVVLIAGALITALVLWLLYIFFGTELGSAIRATGNNDKMIRALGMNTDTAIVLGLMISNGLISLAGALIAQNQSFSDIQMGIGSIVIGLASLIIGEVLFGKRTFGIRLVAIAFGAVIYRIIIAFVIELGMEPTDLRLFTAITVAIALSLPLLKKKICKKFGRYPVTEEDLK